jgi:DNA polymerase V
MRVTARFKPDLRTRVTRPLCVTPVPAGFPSPAEDWIEGRLDLNRHLIRHPAATFFVRVTGDSMLGAGIHSGDLLIVDRALEVRDGHVVVAILNGELLVKRLRWLDGKPFLVSDNDAYRPVRITEGLEFAVWGVVTAVIHAL